jgi:hypothetical protein
MSVPLATTTFTVWRLTTASAEGDSTDENVYTDVATGIRGCVVYHSGAISKTQGSRERVDGRVMCDITSLEPPIGRNDYLVDDTTGEEWQVAFARKRVGLGLDHMLVGVYDVDGFSRGTRDR